MFELSEEQRSYLSQFNLNDEIIKEIEEGEYDNTGLNITDLIKVLFACSRYEDAWNMIRNNMDSVNFVDIFQSPFVQMDREATDVYKYLYDNNIIDKKSYMYFEVLSGKLNDWEFWKNEFDSLTGSQILELIHDSFNDIFVSQNRNLRYFSHYNNACNNFSFNSENFSCSKFCKI